MVELNKSKRAIFPKGEQRKFIVDSKEKLSLTWQEMARLSRASVRNLTDWRNEKISLPLNVVRKICRKRKIKIPTNIEIREKFWYVTKGAGKGGMRCYQKYGRIGGNPVARKKRWEEWWKKEGRLLKGTITNPLPCKKPRFSVSLAEFVGIILGDGGISQRQISVTFHRIDDAEYAGYIKKLVSKLFDVQVGHYMKKNALADCLVISRTLLVEHCVRKLGLKLGNKVKNQVDIPAWIKKNKKYTTACLRGLFDTDGCVIIHKYNSGGKSYSYKKLSFTSRSKPLLKSVSGFLSGLGVKNRVANMYEIRIEAKGDVQRYMELVGSHNPKHLKRLGK